MAAVNSKSRAANETTLRHVWLASLGLLAVSRREVLAARGRLRARTAELPRFSADIHARMAPVLDKLGLAPKPQRATRKGRKVARKPQARRVVRKVGKRVARKG